MIIINKSKFFLSVIFTLFFSILLISTVSAEDFSVNNTVTADDNSLDDAVGFDSIQKMIDNAGSGDSIYLDDEIYTTNGSPITINKNINIYGSSVSNTVLDGQNKSEHSSAIICEFCSPIYHYVILSEQSFLR